MGFADSSTAALLAIRENLLGGLDLVAGHVAAGTFTTVGSKGSAPPCQSGQLTMVLLAGVDAELAVRNGDA